jgi:hypothetical protein
MAALRAAKVAQSKLLKLRRHSARCNKWKRREQNL